MKHFSISKLNKSPAVFDYDKLNWFNGQYIKQKTDEQLLELSLPFLKHLVGEKMTEKTKQKLLILMPIIKERITNLSEVPDKIAFAFNEIVHPEAVEFLGKKGTIENAKKILENVIDIIPTLEGKSEEEGGLIFSNFAEQLSLKMGEVMMPIRVAVTGSKISPPIVGCIHSLGLEETILRIRKALDILKKACLAK